MLMEGEERHKETELKSDGTPSTEREGTPVSAHLSLGRSLVPWGIRATFTLQSALPKFSFPLLVDGIVTQLFPREIFKGLPLINMKGRDQGNVISPPAAATIPVRDHELFMAQGFVIASPRDTSADYTREVFSLSVTTPFEAFIGSKQIAHQTRIHAFRFPELGLATSQLVHNIGILFPVRLTAIRFGLDIFDSSYFGSIIGLGTLVTQTLLIEADESQLQLRIHADGLRSKDDLPLQRDGLFDRLDKVLREALQVSPLHEYRAQRA